MASEQSSASSETVEQTKQQIRAIVGEISQLSKSDLGAEEFYAAYLQRIVSALAAVGGAIWIKGSGQKPALAYQINLSETLLDASSQEAASHQKLINALSVRGEPQLVPPLSSADNEEVGGNPTRYLLVLAPLAVDGQVEGVVEIFQRPDSQPATQRGYLRFLVQMAELASDWLRNRKLKQFSDRHSLWAQADHFSRLAHETLDVRETCYTIVNEGRRLIGCDRVTVALMRGRKCKVEAVSGQDAAEDRSNVIASLNTLASKVVAMGEPLWYDGSTEDLPPQVEHAIEEYVEESYTKSMAVLPIRKPKTIEDRVHQRERHEASSETNESNEIIGALIIEQIETDLPHEVLAPRIDLVYEHSARALSNAVDHHSLFLMPVWKTLGKASWVVKARNLPKTITVAVVVLLLALAMTLIPADFELKSKGALQPVIKREIFVNEGGTVVGVEVEDQQTVQEGDVLVELYNPDLLLQIESAEGELQATLKRLYAANDALLHSSNLSEEEKVRLAGQVLEYKATIASLKAQREVLEGKRDKLTIRSPIDGIVLLSWDVEKSLKRRRVEPGQVLMSVVDPTGPWELELFMAERRMGHVYQARNDIQADLPVRYILQMDPSQDFQGQVKYIDHVTRIHQDDGHTVRVRVDIDKDAHESLRPGATVTGQIYCGRRPWGYTLFHEAFEWVQANLLF